jgi:hypothetical protein
MVALARVEVAAVALALAAVVVPLVVVVVLVVVVLVVVAAAAVTVRLCRLVRLGVAFKVMTVKVKVNLHSPFPMQRPPTSRKAAQIAAMVETVCRRPRLSCRRRSQHPQHPQHPQRLQHLCRSLIQFQIQAVAGPPMCNLRTPASFDPTGVNVQPSHTSLI